MSNPWIGANWQNGDTGISPPPQWDGSKFVFIDPTFGDGNGIGEPRLRYIGPTITGNLDVTLNVKALARPFEILFFGPGNTLYGTFPVTATGRQVVVIDVGNFFVTTFDLVFRSQNDLAGLYDVDFTIGEEVRQQVFVYTMNRAGRVGAWSRYVFPFEIDATAQLGETLFLRSGDTIYRVSEDATTDAGAPIESIVQWPWLDFGTPGVTKMLQTVDVVGDGPGTVSLQVGYDQRAVEAFTPAYTIPIDTLTGMPIPIPVSAPTLSVRLSFTGKWSLQAVNVNLAESRRTT